MRKIFAVFVLGFLAGCSGPQFKTIDKPVDVKPDQVKIDQLECSRNSQSSFLFLWGIGWLINDRIVAGRYEDCMTSRGYKVEEI